MYAYVRIRLRVYLYVYGHGWDMILWTLFLALTTCIDRLVDCLHWPLALTACVDRLVDRLRWPLALTACVDRLCWPLSWPLALTACIDCLRWPSLQPENLMVDGVGSALRLKLIDFGDAVHIASRPVYPRPLVGSAEFTAPELVNGQPVSLTTDIWWVAGGRLRSTDNGQKDVCRTLAIHISMCVHASVSLTACIELIDVFVRRTAVGVYVMYVRLYVRPAARPFVPPSILPSVRPPVCMSAHPSWLMCPSVRPSVARPSVRPPVARPDWCVCLPGVSAWLSTSCSAESLPSTMTVTTSRVLASSAPTSRFRPTISVASRRPRRTLSPAC